MRVNASSSSEPNLLEIDLLATGRLPKIPSAWLRGEHQDLLEPLHFLMPGDRPTGPAPEVDREALAAALATANSGYGHPAAAEKARLLADPATRVVVTGQQPGLWGGPLLSLNKMIAAQRWAEELTASGQPAVAVFWVATEDHDWAEMTRVGLYGRGEARQLDLGEDPAPLLPLGMRTFGSTLPELETEAEGLLGAQAPGLDWARRWYRPDARFGEAFSRLLVSLLGERAPLLFDAMLPEIKELQRPLLRKLVEKRREAAAALERREQAILERGFPLQVKPQPEASPLFLLQGTERRRIVWKDEGYHLRGEEGPARPLAELYEIVEDNPSVLSPGVLARPAIQDALLGTTLQVMGPSEMSYMAQVSSVYPVLDIQAPWTTLRPQAMVLDQRSADYLQELDTGLEEILSTPIDRLLTDKMGEDFVGPVRNRIEGLLGELEGPILELDGSLEKPLRKTTDQIGRNLDQLANKVAAAFSRRHEVWNRRLEQIRAQLLPEGHLQERELSVVYFLQRYGPEFALQIADRLHLDPSVLVAFVLQPGWPPASSEPETTP